MNYPPKERILKMFGEQCFIEPNEIDEARSYLNIWKKYLLRRLNRDSYDVKVIDEEWGEIHARFVSMLAQRSSLYLKIIVEFEWHFEDQNKCEGITIREDQLPVKKESS
jgi:hypothetical protein